MQEKNSKKGKLFIDVRSIKQADSLLRIVLHPLRLRIVELIRQCDELSSFELNSKLDLEQTVIFRQLKLLQKARLIVEKKRAGKPYYSVNVKFLCHLSKFMEQLVPGIQNAVNEEQDELRKAVRPEINFTSLELKIIHSICDQKTSDEIGRDLGLSRRRIEDYRGKILKKMKVRNSVGILIYAVKNSLVKLNEIPWQ